MNDIVSFALQPISSIVFATVLTALYFILVRTIYHERVETDFIFSVFMRLATLYLISAVLVADLILEGGLPDVFALIDEGTFKFVLVFA
ncbi:MAG: hypothetical protein ABJL73_11745, partial [Lentilitoribacter sp.]